MWEQDIFNKLSIQRICVHFIQLQLQGVGYRLQTFLQNPINVFFLGCAQFALFYLIFQLIDLTQNLIDPLPIDLELAVARLLLWRHVWTITYGQTCFLFHWDVDEVLITGCFFQLFPLFDHFLILSFFDTFLIPLHDNCNEHILHSCVEQYHEYYQVYLPHQSLRPCLQECIVHYISVEKREQSNSWWTCTLEFTVLPKNGLPQEDESQEERHDS